MKNYVNIRIQSTSNLKIRNRLKHNLRYVKSLNLTNNENNILIDVSSDRIKEISKTDVNNIYKYYSKKYSQDRIEHNKRYKQKEKRNVRNCFSSWGEGIVSFSESLDNELGSKYTQEDLINCIRTCVLDICKYLNTTPINIILHKDESRIHAHFLFKNYSNTGRSIVFDNRTKEKLSPLQDIGFKHFTKLGMKRGKHKNKKDLGIYDYKTTSRWKQEQLYKQDQKIDLVKEIHTQVEDNLISIQEELTQLTNERDVLKAKRIEVQSDIEKTKEDKKSLYAEISQKQAQIRALIKRHRKTVKCKGKIHQ
ncbi:MAG: hypothetical protein CL623_11440 [Arcobacter sp.]|nr:hypothetical protein [Arcobacter sp.]|tara:strand:+ start:10879 stop:11802 length:924 start_codon:yes stop_codon:yes gene_type:complete